LSLLPLLHLCDSLFPIGGFSQSDGLEAAASVASAEDLRAWLDTCLDETFTRFEGPALRQAWEFCAAGDWDSLAALDREVIALRPSSTTRRGTRAMGNRLLATWSTLHADPRLGRALAAARAGTMAPTLPVAFGIACSATGIARRDALAGYAYTRLASTVSAAMRLMPVGQSAAHLMLAETLERVPTAVDRVETSTAPLECFTPLMDIAAMTQQYMASRLFRS
jgi:urease accessory protein